MQGVFYRASAREQALELGLTGYAKNLPDGRVEVLAFGSLASLDALEAWLRIGPPAAKVSEVVREDDEETRGMLAGRSSPLPIHVVYPQIAAKVRAFVDFLAQRFAGEPEWHRGWR